MTDHDLSSDAWNFRTVGPNCHWCYFRKAAFVWGPYGTNVCAVCQDLIEAGLHWDVVEAVAARITIKGDWDDADPKGWRQREHALMERWLVIRTDRRQAGSERAT